MAQLGVTRARSVPEDLLSDFGSGSGRALCLEAVGPSAWTASARNGNHKHLGSTDVFLYGLFFLCFCWFKFKCVFRLDL